MPRREPLGVWIDDFRVAELTSEHGWDLACVYTPEARDHWPGNVPLLSCSLPLIARKQDASVFGAGLLPEGPHRPAMAAMARVAVTDVHALLAHFGRDVAGALVISPGVPDRRAEAVHPYSPETLADEVASLPERPLGLHDDSEFSIAGLQDKLLLVDLGDGDWGRPVHGAPSTHILKVEDRRYAGMAAAEAQCLALARAVGLTTVAVEAVEIADVPCLIVSRFDRAIGPDGAVARIHQEDACQALARDPDAQRGRGKYESAGGPSLREIAQLLDRWARDPAAELDRLVAAVTFTVVIGNADAHGKNLALLHRDPPHVELAPLYDTVPTVLWPRLRSSAAMSIDGRTALADVTVDDIAAEAVAWHHERSRATAVARRVAGQLLEAVDRRVVDPGSPVSQLVRERATRLLG